MFAFRALHVSKIRWSIKSTSRAGFGASLFWSQNLQTDGYAKDGGPEEVWLLSSFYHESLRTWIKTIVNKFAISNHTALILGVDALRSYLKLICEYELHSLPNKKVSGGKDHGKDYIKVRLPLVRHLLRNRLLKLHSIRPWERYDPIHVREAASIFRFIFRFSAETFESDCKIYVVTSFYRWISSASQAGGIMADFQTSSRYY